MIFMYIFGKITSKFFLLALLASEFLFGKAFAQRGFDELDQGDVVGSSGATLGYIEFVAIIAFAIPVYFLAGWLVAKSGKFWWITFLLITLVLVYKFGILVGGFLSLMMVYPIIIILKKWGDEERYKKSLRKKDRGV